MKKRLLSLALALVSCLSLTVAAQAAATFSDVPSDHWAYTEIQKCCESGIVNGYSDNTFKPGNTVTGAQFAAMLTRMFYPAELAANDGLSSEGWYLPALTASYNANLLSGTSRLSGGRADNWSSSANLPLNRYDMAQMLNNILVSKGVAASASQQNASKNAIKDWTDIPAQYQNAVLNCYALGVLNGTSNGTFSGGSTMNRAQACAVINREVNYTTTETAAEAAPELKMSPGTLSLKAGETGNVKASPSSGTASVSYTSSNQTVATVDAAGKVTAKSAGTAVITASATVNGKSVTAKCTVTVTGSAQAAKTPQDLSAEVVTLVNQERAKQGLAALGTFSSLTAAAETRAPEVAELFEHTRPDGRSCFTALDEARVSYYTAGENIARGAATAESVMQMWMNSSGHKANILNKSFTHIGVAYYNGCWVQMFVGSNTASESTGTQQQPAQTVSVSVSPSALELETGKTGTVRATVAGTSNRVAYASGNEKVATVDSSGTVTAKSAGTAVITASVAVNGKTYSAQCTVTVKERETQASKTPEQLAAEVVDLVNQERAKQGGSPLGTLTSLTSAAGIRAKELPQLFSHTRPDGRDFDTALREAGVTGYYTAGENIARGASTAESVMQMWMNSSGHKANILNKSFTHIGVAYYNGNWVQVFIGSSSSGGSANQGSGSQSSGNQSSGSQGSGNQGSNSQGGGSQGSGNQGSGSQAPESQGSGSQGGGNAVNNPGRSQAVRPSIPSNGMITKDYREDWSNGDYFELSTSGNTLCFSGRFTREPNNFNYVLLSAYGGGNYACTPFVSGQEFSISVQINMESFRNFWEERNHQPTSVITAAPAMGYTPGDNGYVTESYHAARGLCLALDDNGDLAVYIGG